MSKSRTQYQQTSPSAALLQHRWTSRWRHCSSAFSPVALTLSGVVSYIRHVCETLMSIHADNWHVKSGSTALSYLPAELLPESMFLCCFGLGLYIIQLLIPFRFGSI